MLKRYKVSFHCVNHMHIENITKLSVELFIYLRGARKCGVGEKPLGKEWLINKVIKAI